MGVYMGDIRWTQPSVINCGTYRRCHDGTVDITFSHAQRFARGAVTQYLGVDGRPTSKRKVEFLEDKCCATFGKDETIPHEVIWARSLLGLLNLRAQRSECTESAEREGENRRIASSRNGYYRPGSGNVRRSSVNRI